LPRLQGNYFLSQTHKKKGRIQMHDTDNDRKSREHWKQWRSRNRYMWAFWSLCLVLLPLTAYFHKLDSDWETLLSGFCLGVVASVPSYRRLKLRGDYGSNWSPVVENMTDIALSVSIAVVLGYYGWRVEKWETYGIAIATTVICHFLWPPTPEHKIIIEES